MSSFDRKQTPSGAGKKPLLAAGLAVVLAVMVVRYFVKAQPTAAATPPDVATTPQGEPAVEENTADVIRGLADDPTTKWLRGGADAASALDQPPQDPFQMSPEWRASLLKPVPANVTQVNVVQPTRTNDSAVKPAVVTWDPSSIKLQGVFKDGRRSFALVNGSIVTEGMIVGGAKILEVRDDSLVCQPLGATDGLTFEVMLKSRPK